ncbi:MAG: DUF4743 domain-containing protein [Alphaproteobacteria bacterium]|nr:DUF4743 domain-containing protein [Alphaproteobacteria bacterium]
MSYLDHIRRCNGHQRSHFRPFQIAGRRVGWIRAETTLKLAAFPGVFSVEDDRVSLRDQLATPAERGEAVRDVIARLAAAHPEIPEPRGEDYPVVTNFGEPPLMLLDRAMVPLFGVRAFGLHVNGFVRRPEGLMMWIGRRARDKRVAAGKLDNVVAGGQPAGLSLAENLIKEAGEEASIPPDLAMRAVPVGAVSYCMENGLGLKPDTQFCYDLELPEDFQPKNLDGEMEEFMLWPIDAVARVVRDTDEFKFNVNLVIIDFLIRHGHLDPDRESDYLAIIRGLHGRTGEAREPIG